MFGDDSAVAMVQLLHSDRLLTLQQHTCAGQLPIAVTVSRRDSRLVQLRLLWPLPAQARCAPFCVSLIYNAALPSNSVLLQRAGYTPASRGTRVRRRLAACELIFLGAANSVDN